MAAKATPSGSMVEMVLSPSPSLKVEKKSCAIGPMWRTEGACDL
jgi:hypothetical protein